MTLHLGACMYVSARASGPSSDSISAIRCRPPYPAEMLRDTKLGARVAPAWSSGSRRSRWTTPRCFVSTLSSQRSTAPRFWCRAVGLLGQLEDFVQGGELAVPQYWFGSSHSRRTTSAGAHGRDNMGVHELLAALPSCMRSACKTHARMSTCVTLLHALQVRDRRWAQV